MIRQLSSRTAILGFFRILSSKPFLSLLDQCIVSGTRFLVVLLVGRLAGADSLGVYSMAVALLILIALVQEALILRPYLVFANQVGELRRRIYTGSVLLQTGLLIIFSAFIAVCLAVILSITGWGGSALLRLTWMMSAVLPGVLLWEFARRFAFAQMKPAQAVVIDSFLAGLQIIGLLAIGYGLNRLDEYWALAIVGGSGMLVGGCALVLQRQKFLVRTGRFKSDTLRNWHFGKWMFGGQAIGVLQTYLIPYLLAFKIGTSATGIFVACQTIVLLSNPLILGVSNWVGPRAAQLYVQQGYPGVLRLVRQTAVGLGSIMGLFWIVLLFAGEPIINLLFGSAYQGYGSILGGLGLTAVGFSFAVAGSAGLAAIHRPRLIMLGNGLGTGMALLAFFPLVEIWQLEGASLALAIGSLTTGTFKLIVFEWIYRSGHQSSLKPFQIP